MNQSTNTVLIATFAVLAVPIATFADPTTDWLVGSGGHYSWAGGNSALVGSNLPILSVFGDGTSVHNSATLPILDGLLNFTSGAYNGSGWSWGAAQAGTLTLSGCIPGVAYQGSSGACASNGSNNVPLISDDFQSVKIVPVLGSLDAVFGNITGTIDPKVAAYFGVPVAFSAASFTTSILTNGSPGRSFTGVNLLGKIKADPPMVSTPEYWGVGESLAFFGLVIAVFGAKARLGISRQRQPF